MAIARFQMPDGRIARFEVPDGTTPEQAQQMMQEYADQNKMPENQLQPPEEPGLFSRIGADIGNRAQEVSQIWNEGRQKALSGGMPNHTDALAILGKGVGGTLSDIAGELIGSGVKSTYDMLPDKAQDGVGSALKSLAESPPGSAALRGVQSAGKAYSGFKQEHPVIARDLEAVGDLATAFTPIKGKSLAGLAEDAATGTAKTAAKAILPSVDEATKEVALLAKKHNIPLSLDELSNSPVRKSIQKVSQELPLSGQEGFRNKQLAAWNKAVLKTTGEQADEFTPKVMDKAFKRVGQEFDNFADGKTFVLDDNFARGIDAIREEAKTTHTKDALDNFNSMAESILKNVDGYGNISGEKLSVLRSKVNEAARKSTVPGTSELMHDLENQIIDVIADSSPEAAKRLRTAKHQYKNLITIEPLANKAKKGQINPTLLAQRVQKIYGRDFTRGNAGDIGELARVGRELLPVLGGSDTASKLPYLDALKKAATGGTAVGAASVNLPATAAVLGGNRGMQSLYNRNQALVDLAVKLGGQK